MVIVAYMRGGSTLLSQLLNQHPASMVWFEPLDGFYAHLYGARRGWMPNDIHYYLNHTQRYTYVHVHVV